MPRDILTPVIWGAAGALGSSAISKMILREYDTGIVGMLGNAGVVLGMGWVARQVGGRDAQMAALIGGGTMLLVKALTKAGIAGPGTMLGDVTQDADEAYAVGAYYPDELSAYYTDDMSEYALDDELDPGLFDDEFGDDELEDDEFGDDEFGDDEFGDDEFGDDEF